MNENMIFKIMLLVAVCNARDPFPDLTDLTFQTEDMTSSNTYRTKHYSPPLLINQTLIDYAKSRCNLISTYEGLGYGHSGLKSGLGENQYWYGYTSQYVAPASMAVDSWYNEVNNYNYCTPAYSANTAHFTQLVWKGTTDVGCGRCGGSGAQYYETYIVCNYYPTGNVDGGYASNVQKP